MGVLNCTPDSFSDGGEHLTGSDALAHGLRMHGEGAAIVDVGGESTRPGAAVVSEAEELARVLPPIRALTAAGIPVSIDTMKAEVMRQAVAAGAAMVNDVSALTHDPESLEVVAASGAEVCLMHMQGRPATMQEDPQYGDVVAEVSAYFDSRIDACLRAGIAEQAILLDPGIGFGKRLEDNLTLVANLDQFRSRFGMPILLGVSRKSFLGTLTGQPVTDRELETAVAGGIGVFQGADVLRVHDVAQQLRAATVAASIASHRLQADGQRLS